MPNIKPISDLRNYTSVLNEVTYGDRVYLTRNGHGQCAIIDSYLWILKEMINMGLW